MEEEYFDSLYKNKKDVQDCANYREIKLMSHTIKLWERVIEHKLRRIINILDNVEKGIQFLSIH
jgi:hypothetical protein